VYDRKRGKPGNWQVAGPVHTTRNCWVFKAECDNHHGAVAVKIYRQLAKSKPIKWYAKALRRYRREMPIDQGMTVPKLLVAQPDNFALVMEWLDAQPLRQILLTRDLSAEKRTRRIEQCGAWLRQFHELSDIDLQPFDHAMLTVHTHQRVERLKRDSIDQADWDLLKRAVSLLEGLAGRIDGNEVAFANVHGDATTSNLMISGQVVYGLDFDARQRLPLAGDLCRLLVHLDVCKHLATAKRSMDDTAGDRRDVAALKAGYGADLFPGEPFLSYVLLNEIVRRIAVRSDDNASQGGSLGRRFELLRLNRRCKHLVQRLEGL
ncbi:MAG: phosphotransferase, partial [Aestuariivirgaceae bacterium]